MKYELLTWCGMSNDVTIHKEYEFYGNANKGFKFKDDVGFRRATVHGSWAKQVKGVQPSNTFLDKQPADRIGDKLHNSIRSKNVGNSNYATYDIQPYDIWEEYNLNPWDADVVKRVLRTKTDAGMTPAAQRILDYQKIKHICDYAIERINTGKDTRF